ncbi:MAG TPA: 4-hydroxyphenylacetate 3-hydroxylase N-terminal domain-containing protein [Chloroflexota bacterium]|nr:4-hydroxyphenylacetate 3-hydroxylase N-terminal domain-containing protein [Chloroflexota bacterium]
MAIRRGAEFLAGLNDGREVWLGGERVAVLDDERLAPFAHALADIFELQDDPEQRDLLTVPSPATGQPVSRAWHMPRCAEDLVQARQMFELLERRCGGVLGRFPQYMGAVLLGLYNVRQLIANVNPEWAENVERYFAFCRDTDRYLTFGFTDPPRDRGLPASSMEYLHVVERRSDGVVVRGAKAVATAGPYADEYLGLTAIRPELEPQHILYFGIPTNTEGLKFVCRESLTQPCRADHQLSAIYDEIDSWAIFEDVFIPKERIFLLDHVDLSAEVFRQTPSAWGYYFGLIRLAVKAEALAGIAFAVTDYLGTRSAPRSQELLAEVVVHLESLRSFIQAAEREPVISTAGLALPNPLPVQLGRITSLEQHPRVIDGVRELCGSSILMAPSATDLAAVPALRAFVAGADPRAEERFRMLKLAWDYTTDAFGARQLLFEQHNAGTLPTNKARLLAGYDPAPLVELATRLAEPA